MNKNSNPRYINTEQDLDIYTKDDDFLDSRIFRETVKEEVVKEKKIVSRVAAPRMEDEDIETLKRETPKIVGSIFDRIGFLKQRIDECEKAIELRKSINGKMVAEIEEDIKDKKDLEGRLTDIDDKRNLRMDISVLRREARAETVRFWKDLLELRTELSELLEQYQTESKIVSIFNEVEGVA